MIQTDENSLFGSKVIVNWTLCSWNRIPLWEAPASNIFSQLSASQAQIPASHSKTARQRHPSTDQLLTWLQSQSCRSSGFPPPGAPLSWGWLLDYYGGGGPRWAELSLESSQTSPALIQPEIRITEGTKDMMGNYQTQIWPAGFHLIAREAKSLHSFPGPVHHLVASDARGRHRTSVTQSAGQTSPY